MRQEIQAMLNLYPEDKQKWVDEALGLVIYNDWPAHDVEHMVDKLVHQIHHFLHYPEGPRDPEFIASMLLVLKGTLEYERVTPTISLSTEWKEELLPSLSEQVTEYLVNEDMNSGSDDVVKASCAALLTLSYVVGEEEAAFMGNKRILTLLASRIVLFSMDMETTGGQLPSHDSKELEELHTELLALFQSINNCNDEELLCPVITDGHLLRRLLQIAAPSKKGRTRNRVLKQDTVKAAALDVIHSIFASEAAVGPYMVHASPQPLSNLIDTLSSTFCDNQREFDVYYTSWIANPLASVFSEVVFETPELFVQYISSPSHRLMHKAAQLLLVSPALRSFESLYLLELLQNLTWADHTKGSPQAAHDLGSELIYTGWPQALSTMLNFNKSLHSKPNSSIKKGQRASIGAEEDDEAGYASQKLKAATETALNVLAIPNECLQDICKQLRLREKAFQLWHLKLVELEESHFTCDVEGCFCKAASDEGTPGAREDVLLEERKQAHARQQEQDKAHQAQQSVQQQEQHQPEQQQQQPGQPPEQQQQRPAQQPEQQQQGNAQAAPLEQQRVVRQQQQQEDQMNHTHYMPKPAVRPQEQPRAPPMRGVGEGRGAAAGGEAVKQLARVKQEPGLESVTSPLGPALAKEQLDQLAQQTSNLQNAQAERYASPLAHQLKREGQGHGEGVGHAVQQQQRAYHMNQSSKPSQSQQQLYQQQQYHPQQQQAGQPQMMPVSRPAPPMMPVASAAAPQRAHPAGMVPVAKPPSPVQMMPVGRSASNDALAAMHQEYGKGQQQQQKLQQQQQQVKVQQYNQQQQQLKLQQQQQMLRKQQQQQQQQMSMGMTIAEIEAQRKANYEAIQKRDQQLKQQQQQQPGPTAQQVQIQQQARQRQQQQIAQQQQVNQQQQQQQQQRHLVQVAARRQQQMGASDVIDLSGLDPARPPGPTMQQVPQHQGGPGPQGPPRPMTEAERLQYMRMRQMVKQQQQVHARQQGGGDAGGGAMGTTEKEATAKANNEGIRKWEQQQKQKQLSLEQEKLRRVYMEKHASLWDNSIQSQEAKDKHRHLYLQNQAAKWDKAHQQGHPPYTASQAPQTAIPGLPNMFPDTRAPNGAGTSAQLPPAGPSSQQQGIKRNREGGYDSPTPGGEGPGGASAKVHAQRHISRVPGFPRQADEGGHMTAGADTKRLRYDEMVEAAAHAGLPVDVGASYEEEAQSGKMSHLDRRSEGGAVGGRVMDVGSLALVPSGSLPLPSVSARSTNDGCSTEGTIRYVGDDNDLVLMLLKGVKLAHASAVGQGLVGAETFGACRRSFLTWMAVTPMSQLSEQGTDLEQTNGIERRLLRAQSTECSDNAAYCLDLVKTLGFSWFSEGRAPSSMGASGPVSLRGPLIASAPQQPTTSPVLTAHAPATSPPTTAQGVPRSVSAGLEVGGSAGLEVGRETTLEMSRDAQGDGHPALGEVSPTQAVDQLAQGDVLSTQAEVQLALGDVHLTQAEVQLALGDVQLTQAEVQPAQGEVTPTLAEVQPAQGDVHPANMGVHPTPGGEQPTQGEAQAAKADVCPTQAGVQPAQEDVHPANMGVHPTPGGYQPTQKEAQPGQADVQPTPAEVQPAQGEVTPTQAEDERAQGDVRPTQVGVRPTQGGVQAEQVEVQPTQGGVQSTNSVPSLSAQADPQGQAGPQSHSPQGETEPVPQTISKAGEGVHEKEADVLVQDQGAPEAQADICSPSLPPTLSPASIS